jgi:hypothetical protein
MFAEHSTSGAFTLLLSADFKFVDIKKKWKVCVFEMCYIVHIISLYLGDIYSQTQLSFIFRVEDVFSVS